MITICSIWLSTWLKVSKGGWKGVGSCQSWTLVTAHNLSPIEEGGFRDPYVRLMLQPDVDSRKRQTHIHRGESNPYFDQHFKFPVSRDQLQGKELVLQVLDYDRYSHNDIIGEVRISVDGLDLSKSVEVSLVETLWIVAHTNLVFALDMGWLAAHKETQGGSTGAALLTELSAPGWASHNCYHEGQKLGYRAGTLCQGEYF